MSKGTQSFTEVPSKKYGEEFVAEEVSNGSVLTWLLTYSLETH
jgi:hypothetical protein